MQNITLPAMAKKGELLEALKERLIVIEGGTGSGKSVYFPAEIAKQLSTDKYTKVICTENRRILCENIDFVNQIAGEPIAGYRHGEGYFATDDTRLKFMTVGSLLNEFKNDENISGCPCVIVDEVHEMTMDQLLLLSHLRRIMQESNTFKVVLMSATLSEIDKENIRNFFGMDFASIQVEGVMYPVAQHYTGHKIVSPKNYDEAKTTVMRAVKEQIQKVVSDMIEKGVKGTILAFLPGIAEINDIKNRFSNTSLKIAELHSKVSEAEKELAIEEEVNGVKVVLATNVARSGLTVKGVKAVISSGYSRVEQVDEVLGVEGICTELTDFASLEQEKGRTGRTCEGVHYIIGKPIGRPFQCKKSVHTTDLSTPILKHLSTGLTLDELKWFEEPKEEVFQLTLERLKKHGFVNDELSLTELGEKVASMPFEPLVAKMLLMAKEEKVECEAAVIAAVKESKFRLKKSDVIANFDYLIDVVKYEEEVNSLFSDFCELMGFEAKLGLTDPFALTRLRRVLISVFGEITSIYAPYHLPMELVEIDTFVIPGTNRVVKNELAKKQSFDYKPLIDIHIGLFFHEKSLLSTMNFRVDLEELVSPSENFEKLYDRIEKEYQFDRKKMENKQPKYGAYLFA